MISQDLILLLKSVMLFSGTKLINLRVYSLVLTFLPAQKSTNELTKLGLVNGITPSFCFSCPCWGVTEEALVARACHFTAAYGEQFGSPA